MWLGTMLITSDIGNDPSFLRDTAQALEGAGFDAVLANDHVAGGHPDPQRDGEKLHTFDVPCHEPLVLLTFLAEFAELIETTRNAIDM